MERIGSSKAGSSAYLARLLNSGTTTHCATLLAPSRNSAASKAELTEIALLMTQLKVNFLSQTPPPGWAELTRSHWTEIAARHGLPVLKAAILRHMDESDFLPTRAAMNRAVAAIVAERRAARGAEDTRNHLSEMEEARRTWEREREEDRHGNTVDA